MAEEADATPWPRGQREEESTWTRVEAARVNVAAAWQHADDGNGRINFSFIRAENLNAADPFIPFYQQRFREDGACATCSTQQQHLAP